jgi:hypothetical protein
MTEGGKRRWRRWIVLGLAVGAIGTTIAVSNLTGFLGVGSTGIERLVGRHLLRMANDALRPEVSFEDLDYIFPATAVLSNVRLVDAGQNVVEAETVRVIFESRPTRDAPLVIRRIEVLRPAIRVLPGPDGGVLGFTNLVDIEGEDRDDDEASAPSDVFSLRTLSVEDGTFEWRSADGRVMILDALDFDMKSEPETAPGLYSVEATLARDENAQSWIDASLNIDTATAEIHAFNLELDVSPEHYTRVPPSMQEFLAEYAIHGRMSCGIRGTLPLRELADGVLRCQIRLDDANAAVGEFRFPVETLSARLDVVDHELTVSGLEADMWGGRVTGGWRIGLEEGTGARLELSGRDLRLEQALATTIDGESKFAGRTSIAGTLVTGDELHGRGRLKIVEGALMNDPVFGGLMRQAGGKDVEGPRGRDRGSTAFEVLVDRINFTNTELVAGTTAARGQGTVTYDGRLNFRFNAGPLERVQSALGPAGQVVGLLTDRIVTYQVTGTTRAPKFDVRPLGVGTSAGVSGDGK